MLAVAIHEQHGAEPGMIEPGEQGGFLAEIARQRDDLHIERQGRQGPGDVAGVVGAAVVDIDDLDRQIVFALQKARHLGDALVQPLRPFASLKTGTTIDRPVPSGGFARPGAGFGGFGRHFRQLKVAPL